MTWTLNSTVYAEKVLFELNYYLIKFQLGPKFLGISSIDI
jgi:hypothetical protein